MGGKRDGYSNFKFFEMLAPITYSTAAIPASGELSSVSLDTQGYETATIIINIGSCLVASNQSAMAIRLMHADSVTAASYDNVSAGDIFGSAWSIMATSRIDSNISFGGEMALISGIIATLNVSTTSTADGNGQWAFGYRGNRRYLKVMIESTGSVDTGSARIDIMGILGLPADWPVNLIT